MFNARLAGDHLYGKWLFTWQLLVMSLMVSFCAVLFPHEIYWLRFGTELNQFLRVFQPTLVGIMKVMMYTTELFNLTQAIRSTIAPWQQVTGEQLHSVNKVLIFKTSSSTADYLRDINTVCKCRRTIPVRKWKV